MLLKAAIPMPASILRRAYVLSPRRSLGDTLAEVAVAMGLLSASAMGSTAFQVTLARAQDNAARAERALRVAQSASEALRAGIAQTDIANSLRGEIAALPDGSLSFVAQPGGWMQLTVDWSDPAGPPGGVPGACRRTLAAASGRVARCLTLPVLS